MNILHAILLGIIEGITEFLPISSTGHLTIAEKLLGYQVNDAGITAFTAVIQIGSIAAAILYFRQDIIRIVVAWVKGLFDQKHRGADYRMGWYVIGGSIPVAVVGLLCKHSIETSLRGLWVVAIALIVWSIVMFAADRFSLEIRKEKDVTWKDMLFIGLIQCFALIPGVSRSGATIAAGLFRNLKRVTATRLSFFLGIPALVAAGGLEAVTQAKYISATVGWVPTVVAIIASFAVGYIAIAWLIKFISHHNFSTFIVYRVMLGVGIILLLTAGVMTAI